MEIISPPPCPNTVTVRRNPHRRARPPTTPATVAPQMQIPTAAEVRAFPTDEILSMDIANPKSAAVQENLRVFLRIRPLVQPKRDKNGAVGGDRNPKIRPGFKNVWPQSPSKKNSAAGKASQKSRKKNSDVCVKVASSQSVTLSPAPALQDANRTKTEVYDGFSHVFSPDSSQEDVYEKMVRPLVEEFLRGKSGMLAALGPSGSGKTHTVFGSTRQPGMVPLALQQIFKPAPGSDSKSKRSFFISIFEISSERGKGERLLDLSPHGGDLSMQKSTLKGLQEVAISDAREAESIIAQAMLKRATATTNSNCQSSRSQCIINIRGVADKCNGEDNDQASDGVLSIVDLAGAEREKRTGNQGARLLESNFINNTSMVFGLCLRSLLEHQKNPKKPLQKHFQNSLLTKYLRDYLEGKKRMALILTVKSGEEDYRDTSFILRQAAPYMEIKYNSVEEPSSTSYNKRHFQASSLTRSHHHKRMKFTGSDSCVIEEGKRIEAEDGISEEAIIRSTEDPGIDKVEKSGCTPSESVSVESGQRERNHRIMQSFAKVIWNVLKQYNEKLKVADNEIQHLRESLMTEHTRNLELEKEVQDIKSCCSCSHRNSLEVSLVEANTNFKERVRLDGHESGNADETSHLKECESNCTLEKLESTELTSKKDQNFPSPVQVKEGASPFNMTRLWCRDNGEDNDATAIMQSENNEQDATVKSSEVSEVGASCLELEDPNHEDHQTCENHSGSRRTAEDLCEFLCSEKEDCYPNAGVAGSMGNSSQSVMRRKDSCSSIELDHLLTEEDEESSEDAIFAGHSNPDGWMDGEFRLGTSSQALKLEKLERSVSPFHQSPNNFNVVEAEGKVEKPQELPTLPEEDLVSTKVCKIIDISDDEPRVKTSTKAEKPKRRLLPASTMLLRDFSSLDIDDCTEKPKGRKKSTVEEGKRTQGSTTLMRLLQKNLRI